MEYTTKRFFDNAIGIYHQNGFYYNNNWLVGQVNSNKRHIRLFNVSNSDFKNSDVINIGAFDTDKGVIFESNTSKNILTGFNTSGLSPAITDSGKKTP
ncbi:hypothetical protein [Thalassomonas sp. RHCl1]|uniref:hypothetical protein n=1 Tax=Thalassomonas sp. RHCl1 TaxID=2995320 RepID=UPI00248B1D1E|nr:hypothetical protein [Thalassomonas sp. RHCl1]